VNETCALSELELGDVKASRSEDDADGCMETYPSAVNFKMQMKAVFRLSSFYKLNKITHALLHDGDFFEDFIAKHVHRLCDSGCVIGSNGM